MADVNEFERQGKEIVQHFENKGLSRREVIKKAGAGAIALGAAGGILGPMAGAASAEDVRQSIDKAAKGAPLKMFGTNGGLVVDWYAMGKRTMEFWAKHFNVDLTWADGELDATKQRAKVENAATKKWDLAAVTAQEAGTLVPPLKRMVKNGTAIFQMISVIGKPGEDWGYLSWLEQSSFQMGFTVGTLLFERAGGKGTAIETQGPASFTGAQQRHKGFMAALKKYPKVKLLTTDFGNWDPNRAAQLWESYVNKYKEIDIGYFHNDSMAFAGLQALKRAGRDKKTLIGGADAMPDAIKAVLDGRFVATYRHSSCRMHMYPVVIGVAYKLGMQKNVPKHIVIDGMPVTKEDAATLIFIQQDNILLQ